MNYSAYSQSFFWLFYNSHFELLLFCLYYFIFIIASVKILLCDIAFTITITSVHLTMVMMCVVLGLWSDALKVIVSQLNNTVQLSLL